MRLCWLPLLVGASCPSRPASPDAAAAPKPAPAAAPAPAADAARARSTEDRLAALTPVRVAPPPLARTLSPTLRPAPAPAMRLAERSAEKNKITDELDWLEKNQLALPSAAESAERPLPRFFLEKMRLAAVEDERGVLLLFGEPGGGASVVALLDRDRNPVALLDFSAWSQAGVPITWAVLEDRVLYVSAANLYAAERSAGKNAFLSAFDLGGELRWQSEALVANSRTFVVHAGVIFAGYGYTAEPDFVFVLDASSGEVLQKLKVKSGPEVLILKDDLLYVRAYDTNYVFGIQR